MSSTRSTVLPHLFRVLFVLVMVLAISLLSVRLSSSSTDEVNAAPAEVPSLQSSTAGRLEALEAQVAALTRRVEQLEGAAGVAAPSAPSANSDTATTSAAVPRVARNANVRSGPSTSFPVVRTLTAGAALTLVAHNNDAGDMWYQLADEAWVYGSLVRSAPSGLPYVAAPRAAAPAPTAVPTVVPTVVPTAPANNLTNQPAPAASTVCSCSGNAYNCGDFGTHDAAQSCFNYCRSQGVGDVHRLDGDNDGDACESLP